MKKTLYFLGILDDHDIEWMIRNGRKMTLAPGAQIIEQGKPTDSLYFVLDGALVVHTPQAPRIAVLKAGEVVGEVSFVDSRPPSASVRAETPSVVGVIPRHLIAKKLQEDVGFSARFYRAMAVFLADRLRMTTGSLGTRAPQLDESIEDTDELGAHLMASLSMAGLRFAEMQRRSWGA
jgi:CRP-like cAMP-binding protein